MQIFTRRRGVIVAAVVPISVRAIPAAIVPIAVSFATFVALAIIITVAVSSPFPTRFTIFPAHTLTVAAAHPPIAADFTIVIPVSAALGTFLPLLLCFLVRAGSRLRPSNRGFCRLLSQRWAQAE